MPAGIALEEIEFSLSAIPFEIRKVVNWVHLSGMCFSGNTIVKCFEASAICPILGSPQQPILRKSR